MLSDETLFCFYTPMINAEPVKIEPLGEEDGGFHEDEHVRPASESSSTGSSFSSSPPKFSIKHSTHLPRNVCPDICEICGDVATGYHYEVASCNGCKTFFRRTVLCQLKYKCKKSNDCGSLINKQMRVKCRSCRFDRCVEKGMNPFSIQSETSPGTNTVIKNILAKRRLEIAKIEPCTSETPETKLVVHLTSAESSIDRVIDNLLYLELKSDKLRQSSYSPRHHVLRLEDVLIGHSKMGLEFPEPQDWPLPNAKNMYDLTPIEERITKMIPFPDGPTYARKPHAKFWLINDAVCVIEYIKTFPFFHQLTDNDKKLLAKNITLICTHLTSAFYSYANKSDFVVFPDGTVPYGGNLPDSKYEHMLARGIIAPLIQLGLDRKEYVLLKAIIACNDAIVDLTPQAKKILAEERAKYAKSLFHYVMARRGPVEGPGVYAGLLGIIDMLAHVTKKQKDYHILITTLGLRAKKFPLLDDLCDE